MHKPISILLLVVVALGGAGRAQERPLPDAQAFLATVRQRLQTDEQRQSGYVYRETRRESKLDASGKPTHTTVRVFESYPGLPREPRWSRLVSVDGKPVPPAGLEKQDRERLKKVQDYQRSLGRQSDKDRQAQARERERQRRETAAAVDDAFRVYDIRMLGREVIEGHDTIVFSLTPRPDAKPTTREAKILRHFKGKVWLSESEYELVRLDVEALDTLSFGLGLFARVHQGSRAMFQRRKVNGEEWLPASATYTVSGRLLLLKRLRQSATSAFSDYRKFTVETAETVARPK